jgi:pimeloyl-ACP methyl ester carboxylesterase
MDMNHIFRTTCISLVAILLGCSPLSLATAEQNDKPHVEYAMTKHDTFPVIFENGGGGTFNRAWGQVLLGISKDTTTFVYNRPGYGDSDAVNTPRDGAHVADELRSLLLSKGLTPPYVLVGHSLGGLYMQYFSRRYPDEVAALILVDSMHPNAKLGESAREKWPVWDRLKFVLTASAVIKSEMNAVDSTGEAVLGLPAFTGKPVIILSAAHPVEANEKRKDLLRLYPGAKQIWVDSGHLIPRENPESVISAIREVLQLARPNATTQIK